MWLVNGHVDGERVRYVAGAGAGEKVEVFGFDRIMLKPIKPY